MTHFSKPRSRPSFDVNTIVREGKSVSNELDASIHCCTGLVAVSSKREDSDSRRFPFFPWQTATPHGLCRYGTPASIVHREGLTRAKCNVEGWTVGNFTSATFVKKKDAEQDAGHESQCHFRHIKTIQRQFVTSSTSRCLSKRSVFAGLLGLKLNDCPWCHDFADIC